MQIEGQREDELPHRHVREDVVGEVGRGFSSPPSGAGRTESAVLARERDEHFARAATAPDPHEACGQNSAGDELPERACDERRHLTRHEERHELRAHSCVEGRVLGLAAAVGERGGGARAGRRHDQRRQQDQGQRGHRLELAFIQAVLAQVGVCRRSCSPPVVSRWHSRVSKRDSMGFC